MLTRLVSVCFVVSLLLPASARAQPQLGVADTLQYTLRDTASDPTFALTVYSTAGTLTNLRVTVKELKDPDGQSLAPALLLATPEQAQVSEAGTRVRFKPELRALARPGDYLAVVLLAASLPAPATAVRPAVTLLKTLTLRRERAALNLEPLKDITVRLQRPTPWLPATFRLPYYLENGGHTDIRDLSIDSQTVLLNQEEREAAPGSVTVILPPPPLGRALERERTGKSLELLAGKRIDFTLLLTDFSAVGSFKTGLVLHAPAFDRPQEALLKVEVSDRWVFAWAAIALGVLVAFFANLVVSRWRPLEENRQRIAQLGTELEELQRSAAGPKAAEAVARFSDLLRRASLKNQSDEVAVCGAQLDELERAIEEFHKQRAELRAAVRERLEQAQQLATALATRRTGLSTEQLTRLKDARVNLLGDVAPLCKLGILPTPARGSSPLTTRTCTTLRTTA